MTEKDLGADLVVVGAGIVGLAHAWHAVRAGMTVVVVERDGYAVGASVRNFGHVCTTAQGGDVLPIALAAREHWLHLGRDAGLEVRRAGTVLVARSAAEQAVLNEFAEERGDAVRSLTPGEAARLLGLAPSGVVGALHLVQDLRVDAPTALPAIAAHLERLGVRFRWRTAVRDAGDGVVTTTRGRIRAGRTVLAVGHDVDRFFPDTADEHGLTRCRLRMLEVDAPGGAAVGPALLTGTSMLRYDGLTSQPSARRVREEVLEQHPALLEHVVNLMLTQRPDGRLVIGDTHHYGVTEDPFEDERSDELVLAEAARLLGADLVVRRRWRGVYASAPTPFLVAQPRDGVQVVSVTSGIGMTTALGLAERVLTSTLVAA
ncbi:TIGR03364 family FAD-dependent oxidoreductase [Amnibacterium endophyticum]|uniref:TIGR03364 family FAD-dependent oxidoreductase n=1 Tax=Amnibacterium endophyticum TaxID=2109337 RepID=A0ABW4LF31_9MICO